MTGRRRSAHCGAGSLSTVAATALLIGYTFIRAHRIPQHRAAMITAFVFSTLLLVGTDLAAVLLLLTLLGGFTREGATTNSGWFALIVALMCIPFGGLLLTLGVAKRLKNLMDQEN